MAYFLSWDSFMNMPSEFEADLECVSISSDSSDVGPLAVHKKNKSPEIEDIEMEIPMYPPLIYRDTTCTFSKGDSMSWYQVNQELSRQEFL